MNPELLEQMIKDVITSMGQSEKTQTFHPKSNNQTLTQNDYPIQTKRPELLKTPTGKNLNDITLEAVMNGQINAEDVRISPETLELQAQVAESVGREPFARNLRRAAELIAIPDDRILEIYNALRPNRSTKEELLEIAEELETKYNATINAAFVREAADVYTDRDVLRVD